MLNQIVISFEDDHVLARTGGDKDYLFLEQLWRQISRECEKHQCFNVLGIANTTTAVEVVEAYDLPGIFHSNNIDHRYRIAWVEENPDSIDMIEFLETVLANRGLPGRAFETEEKAREWLLGGNAG